MNFFDEIKRISELTNLSNYQTGSELIKHTQKIDNMRYVRTLKNDMTDFEGLYNYHSYTQYAAGSQSFRLYGILSGRRSD